jgi:predicted nucleotidyltransferase
MSERPTPEVLPVSEARARLTGILRNFRADAAAAEPVVIGSHRRAAAVLVPVDRYLELTADERRRTPFLPELIRRRATIERLARANHAGNVRVFGSVARRDDGPASDIDLLVDPDDDATLFDLAQLEIDLEALLERRVDVVSSRSLDRVRDRGILDDALAL